MDSTADDTFLSEEQFSHVRQVVHDEALRSRVAASFLPLFGPLPGDTQVVPSQRVGVQSGGGMPGEASERLTVDDYDTLRLCTVAVNVYLKTQQVADPELSSALIMFRRAANVVARIEDAVVFTGQSGEGRGPRSGNVGVPEIYTVTGGGDYDGLVDAGAAAGPVELPATDGNALVGAIVSAIGRLEQTGHLGPFACVLGDGLFNAANTPDPGSLVLPRDRILPFLDGPLLRSSTLEDGKGVVVSLQGGPVEIVVPSDISVRYLQTTLEPRLVFRVAQRFVLRIKEPEAVVTLTAT